MTSDLKSYIGQDYDEKNARSLLVEIQKNGVDTYLTGCYQLITSLRSFSEQYQYLRSCVVGIFHALKYSELSTEKKEINILINAMYELDHHVCVSKGLEKIGIKFGMILVTQLSLITNKLHMKYFIDFSRVMFRLNNSANLHEDPFDELLDEIKSEKKSN